MEKNFVSRLGKILVILSSIVRLPERGVDMGKNIISRVVKVLVSLVLLISLGTPLVVKGDYTEETQREYRRVFIGRRLAYVPLGVTLREIHRIGYGWFLELSRIMPRSSVSLNPLSGSYRSGFGRYIDIYLNGERLEFSGYRPYKTQDGTVMVPFHYFVGFFYFSDYIELEAHWSNPVCGGRWYSTRVTFFVDNPNNCIIGYYFDIRHSTNSHISMSVNSLFAYMFPIGRLYVSILGYSSYLPVITVDTLTEFENYIIDTVRPLLQDIYYYYYRLLTSRFTQNSIFSPFNIMSLRDPVEIYVPIMAFLAAYRCLQLDILVNGSGDDLYVSITTEDRNIRESHQPLCFDVLRHRYGTQTPKPSPLSLDTLRSMENINCLFTLSCD